jgi:endoglucanase
MKKQTLTIEMKGKFLFLAFIGLIISTIMRAELPTAKEIASKMKIGCNLGNTLEAICGENAWGAGHTSQQLIDSIKAVGFNTIRLPVAWFCHSDTVNSIIDEAWLARVKEVVDYCINDDMYVIINVHWDNGWLENRVNKANQSQVNERQAAYWTQIAGYFKDYDEHLLFAGANEPNVSDATGMAILLSYHQTFIDAVRATGGNNSSRTLIVQGPSTDIDLTYKLMNTMPTDQIADRLIEEIHYYTPYQFCLMSKDESWGKMFYYWGKGNHSTTDVTRNANWGEESDVEKYFGMMKTKFVDKGIPVIIGEYGVFKRKLSPPSDQALHDASVEYYHKYIVKSSTSKGIIPFLWDTPGGLFNRSTCEVLDRSVVNAIMQGVKEASTGIAVIKNSDIEVYPNPFTSAITLKINNQDEILRVSIFNIMGNQIETIEKTTLKNTFIIGSSLRPGMYLLKIYKTKKSESFKIVKS